MGDFWFLLIFLVYYPFQGGAERGGGWCQDLDSPNMNIQGWTQHCIPNIIKANKFGLWLFFSSSVICIQKCIFAFPDTGRPWMTGLAVTYIYSTPTYFPIITWHLIIIQLDSRITSGNNVDRSLAVMDNVGMLWRKE